MKKLLILLSSVFLFANSHMTTNDKALQEALNGNYKKAFSMFEKRCKKNEGYACGMVGYFYDKGFGIEKNHQKAITYYKKGCNLNDADSCTLLGYEFYKNGNLKKAKELLNKACKLGNKDACNYLKKIQ
ncbi:cysteine-rich Sel1 repeat protein [Caminibacter mediatlanticus TB-2]|uniref:beta-lactamase n=1 Tax=Caminibacter mediatlanticus TB-2 TaxID=391592 RepID=A0AAI9F2N2_9BACT|nr:cysteine-rich Sel1 repeat protein [Caminibacter mediatlanticus]EDM23766.1 cysteine-rich protein A [Caminibacter mediatlanticus TB-2]QCT94660.1 cysteine-rich Sel1 repeat protein [Caminibacter mediatlanticus TB-2]